MSPSTFLMFPFNLRIATMIWFRIISLIPLAALIYMIAVIGIGLVIFGHLPEYGVDPDPTSTFHPVAHHLNVIILLVLIALLSLSPFIFFVTLIFDLQKVSRAGVLKWSLIYIVGVGLLFLMRTTSAFHWLVD